MIQMKLIADSGSTKTDWALVDENGKIVFSCQTQGLNPYHLSDAAIREVLKNELQDALSKKCAAMDIKEVHFYGSGVTEAMKPRLHDLLSESFPEAEVCAEGDLLGAARCLFGHGKGIACILGTGSNSCLYDGEKIVMNTPPLGYVLGDEGSGTDIGKHFLNQAFKGFLPAVLKERYMEWSGLDYAAIINKVYREPLANKFLASIAQFVSAELMRTKKTQIDTEEQRAHLALDMMVQDCFNNFYLNNLSQYVSHLGLDEEDEKLVPIGFVGSIAYHFKEQLEAVCCEYPLDIVKIVKSPLLDLVTYHASEGTK